MQIGIGVMIGLKPPALINVVANVMRHQMTNRLEAYKKTREFFYINTTPNRNWWTFCRDNRIMEMNDFDNVHATCMQRTHIQSGFFLFRCLLRVDLYLSVAIDFY